MRDMIHLSRDTIVSHDPAGTRWVCGSINVGTQSDAPTESCLSAISALPTRPAVITRVHHGLAAHAGSSRRAAAVNTQSACGVDAAGLLPGTACTINEACAPAHLAAEIQLRGLRTRLREPSAATRGQADSHLQRPHTYGK